MTVFSMNSRRNLRRAVRGLLDARSFLTVTMPPDVVVDGATLRRWWDRLREWLLHGRVTDTRGVARVLGASGVMAKEFTDRGVPHLHVVVDVPISPSWLADAWCDIVGCHDPEFRRRCGTSSHVHNQSRLASYMAKVSQKVLPEGFEIGRWWSAFGANKPKVVVAMRGRREDLIHFLVALWDQRPEGRATRTADGLPPLRFWLRGGLELHWKLWEVLGLVSA